MQSNDRILLWAPNSAEWVAAFWGCLLIGAVAVPMDDSASPDFAERVARDSQIKLIVASRNKPQLDSAIPVLVMEDLPDIAAQHRVLPTQTVPRETPKPIYESLPAEALSRQHVAEILFTSGTTAEPRGVVLTHGNFLANLEPIERGMQPYLKYERLLHPLRFVSLVPLSHVFGQFMALFVPPLLGTTVVFENSAHPGEILRTIKRERATLLIAVPRMLDLLRSAIEREIDSCGWRSWFDKNYAAAEAQPFLRRAWRFRRIHRLFGFRFWAFISGGAALASDTEAFLQTSGFCRSARLWHDRNRFAHQPQSPLQRRPRLGRQNSALAANSNWPTTAKFWFVAKTSPPAIGKKDHCGNLRKKTTAGCAPATSANSMSTAT